MRKDVGLVHTVSRLNLRHPGTTSGRLLLLAYTERECHIKLQGTEDHMCRQLIDTVHVAVNEFSFYRLVALQKLNKHYY